MTMNNKIEYSRSHSVFPGAPKCKSEDENVRTGNV